ncbi:MAG: MTAP family purine nucleoside phosphorylase [Tissierellia bacterium]|nr:MTAP family purine nucleoside phosphorylase [Tissierellia bacterium]
MEGQRTYAIIGGTGMEDLFPQAPMETVSTAYGEAVLYLPQGKNYYFLPRHGKEHHLPPHRINYRANIAALKKMGVVAAFGLCAVGSLREELRPGTFALISDFLDFTKSRPTTFFDGEGGQVRHLDVSEVYSEAMNASFERHWGHPLPRAVYVATEGPRFETASENRFYASIGGDLVGMTNVPEAPLALEAGIRYSCLAHIINYGTGIHQKVTIEKSQDLPRIVPTLDGVFAQKMEPMEAPFL